MHNLRSSFFRSEIKKIIGSHLRLPAPAYFMAAARLLLLLAVRNTAFADSATWNLNADGNWYNPTNWSPATVPNGPADTATFGVSNVTGVGQYDGGEVNGIVFKPGASAFTITVEGFASYPILLTISGVGITNNSEITQSFVIGFPAENVSIDSAMIQFTNNATAGNLTAFTNIGGETNYGPENGVTAFYDTSSAGTGTFTNNGSDYFSYIGGITVFYDSATADRATLIADGCTISGAAGGTTTFQNTSTAGNATLIANGGSGGGLGGIILFEDDSTGGTARVKVFGNGSLDVSAHNHSPGVTVGSIEGDGVVFLGANNLTVGSNNLSTIFSGLIQDGGSLSKIGTGTLTLTGANTYTGRTTINRGRLWVNNMNGSGTGNGTVRVSAGTLGGQGTIAGEVIVGNGGGASAVLAPGKRAGKPGRPLTIQGALTFYSDATYKFGLNTKSGIADKVVANGVIISGAEFSFVSCGNRTLPPGTVFTVIDNTAPTPIAGTFRNLHDGSVFISNGNTYQASYEGGDGNDLTLTVVP